MSSNLNVDSRPNNQVIEATKQEEFTVSWLS